jgi:hypothetical protein
MPMVASAQITQAPENCTLKYDFSDFDEACTPGDSVNISEHGMCCLLNTLYNVTDWIFVILVGLASIFVILGAMTLIMAAGSPEKVSSGRNYIMYAAIGLLVAFLAKAIPGVVKLIAGM